MPHTRNLLAYLVVVTLSVVALDARAQDCRPGQTTTEVKCSTASKCRACIPKCVAYDGLVKRCREVESARDTNAQALAVSEASRALTAGLLVDTKEALRRSNLERERLQRELKGKPHPAVVATVSVAVGAAVGVLVFVLATRTP